MHSNFNRQFIMLDFQLLEDPAFLQFVGSSEFATYLVLRRYIWRGSEQHYMGLHEWYLKERRLVCSLDRDNLAKIVGRDPQNVSAFISSLEKRGVVMRKRTGRQNIYVLGEWIDVKGDGSLKVEWFYLDGAFGITKSDIVKTTSSDVVNLRHQTADKASLKQNLQSANEMRLEDQYNNKEKNKETNTVSNGVLQKLSDIDQPKEKIDYVAELIVAQLGDRHSKSFYRLVAAKVPEHVIYQTLAEIKADGAQKPAAVFTYRVNRYALEQLSSTQTL